MRMSIVIPVWNNAHFTKSCLADLAFLPNDHEIIVVDNGSDDNTEQVVKACEKRELQYIKLDKNYGFAHACNKGFEISQGEYVCFLNNDTKVRHGGYMTWTELLIKNAGDGLIGPTIGLLHRNLEFVKESQVFPEERFYLIYVSGWNITAKKETWNKLVLPGEVGPFSTQFGRAYFEDSDLGLRASELGISLKIQDVPMVHFGKMTSRKLNTASLYLSAKQLFKEKWTERSKNISSQY